MYTSTSNLSEIIMCFSIGLARDKPRPEGALLKKIRLTNKCDAAETAQCGTAPDFDDTDGTDELEIVAFSSLSQSMSRQNLGYWRL